MAEDHIRHCVQYEFEKGSSMKLALKNIQQTYGAKSLSESTCRLIYKNLRLEKTNVEVEDDDVGSDTTTSTTENGKHVNGVEDNGMASRSRRVNEPAAERPKRRGASAQRLAKEPSEEKDDDDEFAAVKLPKSMPPPPKKQARRGGGGAAPKLHEKPLPVPAGFQFIDGYKNEFVLGKEIGTGGFGRIYEAKQLNANRQVAVKMEPMMNGPLFTEMHVYLKLLKEQQLTEFKKSHGIDYLGLPSLISSGRTQHNGEELRYLIIPKYGDSVEAALTRSKTCFSLSQSLNIARCVLHAYQYLHSEGYTHADVKASNLLMEKKDDFKHAVLIDFGLARKLPDPLVEKEDKKSAHNGTIEFTSCDAHRGCLPSYRGDLEILTHNILYWLTCSLPWEGNSDPDAVFALKQSLVQNVEKELPALISNKKSLSVVRYLYKLVRKMTYTSQIDFVAINKAFDKAF